MTDSMLQEQHHIPDGTRPLVVAGTHPGLTPALLEVDAEPIDCHVVVHNTAWDLDIPVECRRQIRPREHYLLHAELDTDGEPTGKTWQYCAPCAIRDAHWWDVREATA